MFGPVARRKPSARRHSRRLIFGVALLVVVLVVLAVEVGLDVTRSQHLAQHRLARSWGAAVAAIVDQSNTVASLLATSEQPPSNSNCAEADDCGLYVEASFDTAASQANSQLAELNDLALPAPSAPEERAILGVLTDRVSAAADLEKGVALAISSSASSRGVATNLFVDGEIALERSDAAYQQLRGKLRRSHPAIVLPASKWATKVHLGPTSATELVSRLETLRTDRSASLTIVALSLSPAPVRYIDLPTTTTPFIGSSTTTSSTTTSSTTSTSTTSTTTAGGATSTTTTSVPASRAHPSTTTSTSTTSTLPPATREQIPPESTISVLAPTGQLSVSLSVRSGAATTIRSVSATASLAVITGTHRGEVSSRRQSLGALAPGQASFVTLGSFKVPPGSKDLLVTVNVRAAGLAIISDPLRLEIAS